MAKMTRQTKDASPSPEDIAEALAELENHTRTTPSPAPIQTLKDASISPPVEVGQLIIKSFEITSGSPRNGALRSDDHISSWETVFKSRDPCPDCGSYWREYEYTTHHNIAGHSSETCQVCEHTFDSQEWG